MTDSHRDYGMPDWPLGRKQRRDLRVRTVLNLGFDAGSDDGLACMNDSLRAVPMKAAPFCPYKKRKYAAAWNLGYAEGWSK